MTEEADNKNSVKITQSTLFEIADEQNRLKRLRPGEKKPTRAQIIDMGWAAYKRERDATPKKGDAGIGTFPGSNANVIPINFLKGLGEVEVAARAVVDKVTALRENIHGSDPDDELGEFKKLAGSAKTARQRVIGTTSSKRPGGGKNPGETGKHASK